MKLPVCPSARPVTSGSLILCLRGRTDAAITALYAHLTAWPRDALVVSAGANPHGLIGGSGRIGQKHQIAVADGQPGTALRRRFLLMSYHAGVNSVA